MLNRVVIRVAIVDFDGVQGEAEASRAAFYGYWRVLFGRAYHVVDGRWVLLLAVLSALA